MTFGTTLIWNCVCERRDGRWSEQPTPVSRSTRWAWMISFRLRAPYFHENRLQYLLNRRKGVSKTRSRIWGGQKNLLSALWQFSAGCNNKVRYTPSLLHKTSWHEQEIYILDTTSKWNNVLMCIAYLCNFWFWYHIYEGWNFNFGNTPLDWIQELLEWRANAAGRKGPSPT